MNILWFKHVINEDLGTLGEWLDDHDILPIEVSIHYGGLIPSDPGAYHAMISMGGPMSVNDTDTQPWIEQELDLLRKAMEQGMPLLGICLGAQLLAKAANARVRPQARPEVGFGPVRLTPEGRRDPLFAGLPDTFDVLHWHGETFELPQGAVCLAESDDCPNQAFRLGDNVYGLQFHVETTSDMAQAWLRDNANWLAGMSHVDPRQIQKVSAAKCKELQALAVRLYANWLRAIGHGDELES